MIGAVATRDPGLQARIRRTGWTIVAISTSLFLASTAYIMASATHPFPERAAEKLPVLMELPDFSLEAQEGGTLARKDLSGNVWVFDFVFTRCSGPCPSMSKRMGELQKQLEGDAGIKLISVTVDPAHDTKPVLADYAKAAGAKPGRWLFATGDKTEIFNLSKNGFKLGVEDPQVAAAGVAAMPLLHSTRFALVDSQARIRGYYDGTDAEAVKRLVTDARALAGELR